MISKNGNQIMTIEDWLRYAGPKRRNQWSEGRSAFEVAQSWLSVQSPNLPLEVSGLFMDHECFGEILQWTAAPEVRLPFDHFKGEPRNTDLLVYARDNYGDFLIAVEAKADETFGETVAEALASAVERGLANPRSRGVERIEALAALLLGPRREGEAALRHLRYQLLTGVAGAISAALNNQHQRVVFLVHEFRTQKTINAKHDANAKDLNSFVHRLSHGKTSAVPPGRLCGPFSIAGHPSPPRLFIGKSSCNLRQR